MVLRILLFAIAALICAETGAEITDPCETKEITDHCESKVKVSVSLDLAIHLLEKVKDYNNQNQCNKTLCNTNPIDCEDVLLNGENKSGIYTVWPRSRIAPNPIKVYCDMDTAGGGWTVFQRRGDFGRDKEFFLQDWNNFKKGFGDVDEEFWLGNDNIFALSNQRDYSLRVDLRAFGGEERYATYDTFWIDDEYHNYTLHIAGYRNESDAGDSMIGMHNEQEFSTKDRISDKLLPTENTCEGGNDKVGWWRKTCYAPANLNGVYNKNGSGANAVIWRTFKRQESLSWTEMKIRSREFPM